MGDRSAAVQAVGNPFYLRKEILLVGKVAGNLEDVFHKSCFFIDNRQGVIDLMRYSCRKPPNRRELPRVLCLDDRFLPLLLRLLDPVHDSEGYAQVYGYAYCDKHPNEIKHRETASEDSEELRIYSRLDDDAQEPLGVPDRGIPEDKAALLADHHIG